MKLYRTLGEPPDRGIFTERVLSLTYTNRLWQNRASPRTTASECREGCRSKVLGFRHPLSSDRHKGESPLFESDPSSGSGCVPFDTIAKATRTVHAAAAYAKQELGLGQTQPQSSPGGWCVCPRDRRVLVRTVGAVTDADLRRRSPERTVNDSVSNEGTQAGRSGEVGPAGGWGQSKGGGVRRVRSSDPRFSRYRPWAESRLRGHGSFGPWVLHQSFAKTCCPSP